MVRLIILTCAALSLLAMAACSNGKNIVAPTDNGLLGTPDTPEISSLPELDSLSASNVIKGTSAIVSVPGHYVEGNNTSNAEVVGLNSIRLNSSEEEISAVWYGVNVAYSGRTVPYLAPYTMTINTAGNSKFWVVMADYKGGNWSTLPTTFKGSSVEVEVGLEPNAGNIHGTYWFAIVAYGGEIVTIHSIDMDFPAPPLAEDYITYETNITASDGTRLATEVYMPRENNFNYPPLPAPPGPAFPVILLRTPYDKSNITSQKFTLLDTERSLINWMADLNVCVVTQYFRGRLDDSGEYPDSDGTETLFREHAGPDHTDAIDTVEWLEKRNFYNGDLFLTGPSALGLWVYQSAPQLGDRVSGIYPQISSGDVGAWSAKHNGCFKESNLQGWLTTNGYPLELYTEARTNFKNQPYWDAVNFNTQASGVDCPGYHETGWWDVDVSSTIDTWRAFNENGGPNALGNQKLIIGPWSHDSVRMSEVGEVFFPTAPPENDATSLPDGWDGAFWTLANLGRNPIFSVPDNDVLVYFMGADNITSGVSNEWVELDNWPPSSTETKYLLTSLGALDFTGDIVPAAVSVNCNPNIPTVTLGGELLPSGSMRTGPYNQAGINGSPVVANFRSEELAAPLAIAGEITVDVYISTQAVDTDIMVKVIDHYSAAKQMLVADSAMRLSHYLGGDVVPDQVYKVTFKIADRAYVFGTNHRIGIDIQASNSPRFAVNPGNGDDFVDGPGDLVLQLNEVHFGPSTQSAVYLPVYTP